MRALLSLQGADARARRVQDKLAACNKDLVVIPGGMTPQLEPLDVCLKKPVKDKFRALYTDWLIN